ncbi:MAG: hypothetical protein E3J72_04700 [Planctomycetota bacterium]|nr:MAG: hypothetical protein E3J72_04700 [Planctomycetota bacterium]
MRKSIIICLVAAGLICGCAAVYLLTAKKAPSPEKNLSAEEDPSAKQAPSEKDTLSEKDATSAKDAPSAKIEPLDEKGNLSFAPPVTYKNLTIFPILAREVEEGIEYLTLDEGMEEKLVEISEKQNAQVSELSIHNKSDKPLYLLGGEIVVGGKQDRIVAQSTIVPPKTKMGLSSFCVERGRWSGRRGQVAANDHTMLFAASMKLAKSTQRYAAQIKKDQGANWAVVDQTNKSLKTVTPTSTLKAAYDSKEVKKKTKAYMDALKSGLEKSKNLVGFIVVINGEVESCDMFRSPKLFSKLRDKLLNSYVMEALTSGKCIEKKVTEAEALRWLTDVREKSDKKVLSDISDRHGKRKIIELESSKAAAIRTIDGDKEVHSSYFQKR